MPPVSITPRVLVVVPALDEQACVGRVVDEIRAAGLDCLVVDDGSTDATADVAAAHGAEVVTLERHTGVGAALREGFRHAIERDYDIVIRVDADGQHPVDACALLLHAMAASTADMVVGSRFATPTSYRAPVVRRIAIAALARSIRRRTGQAVTDPTSGLRAISRPLLDTLARELPDHYLGDTHELTLQALRAGYDVVEVPVAMRPRQGGRSSVTWRTAFRSCVLLVRTPRFELAVAPQRPSGPHRTATQTPIRLSADSPTRATT